MPKVKTTEKQLTELAEKIWSLKSKAKRCFVCEKRFEDGDKIYILANNNHQARHTNCARWSSVKSPCATTEEEHLEEARRNRQPIGGAKKQACSGHGYSGGTGFKTIE